MQRLLCLLLFALTARADTIAVLPFFNLSKSPSLDWIGESIAETVRESLASVGVLVLDRADRVAAYRRLSLRPGAVLTRASVLKIGESLDASQIVYGQYELKPAEGQTGAPSGAASKGSLRIIARILDLKHLKQGPEFGEAGALEDLAALETHLGWQALQFLAPKSAPPEEEFRRERPPVRLDAVESFVRGLLANSPEQKHRFFTQAARIDPRFSQPCFQLGQMNYEKKEYGVAAGWLEKVTRADSHYLEANFLLGLCRYNLGDYAKAEQSFRLVADSVPLNEVWNNLGAAQSRRKNRAAAESFAKALDGDNADPDYHFNLGYVRWQRGQFDIAADSFRAALDRNRDDAEATVFLGRCLKKDGPRPGDPRSEGRERLKTNYEETGYRQLKAELEPPR